MKEISVIIPMYNSQNTIEECLRSLCAQTVFDDMELLLVDDHSSDNTVERAMVFERMHPDNIMIIKLPENGGPGNARNIALEYAQGNYIGFVDSDDAVTPIMYEKLYTKAERSGADVVDGGFYDQAKDEAIVYTSDELTGTLNAPKRSRLIVSGGYIWSKLYRRDFLISENIKFRNEYILEDMDFLMEVFCKMGTITNVKEVLYVYRDSTSSLSKTVDVDKYMHATTSAMKGIYNKLSVIPNYEGVKEAVEYSLLQLYSFSINIILKAVKDGQISSEKALLDLNRLRDQKTIIVSGGYDNQYVCSKIDAIDISIMKENDKSPEDLLAAYKV